jgi:hypothetical protein
MDNEVRKVISEEGIQLINWKTIGANTDWASVSHAKF